MQSFDIFKISGYNIARMKYKIIVAPDADADLKRIRVYESAKIQDKIKEHLAHEPTKVGKTSIKKLRGLNKPQFRLRVDEHRIFYDVTKDEVHILAIVPKSEASEWLKREGKAK